MKQQIKRLVILYKSIPPLWTSVYFMSVILMNILAGKELLNLPYLALDCGYLLSWIPFLYMDVMCKYYNPRVATEIAITALILNLLFCMLFKLVASVPGHWSEYYAVEGQYSDVVDRSLNRSIGGSWYILMGSSLAMLASSITNSSVYALVSRFTRADGFRSFATRSYISTTAGQFVDNMVFTTVVSHVIFGWSWTQVVICASFATVIELLCEVFFSPFTYRMCSVWKRVGIGKAFLEYEQNRTGK